jgi:hypothetical protein
MTAVVYLGAGLFPLELEHSKVLQPCIASNRTIASTEVSMW